MHFFNERAIPLLNEGVTGNEEDKIDNDQLRLCINILNHLIKC